MNEAALCSQQLDRLYGPLREQVAQSLKRQDTVLRQLKVATLASFCDFFIAMHAGGAVARLVVYRTCDSQFAGPIKYVNKQT